jgi:hypothetical protein
MSASIGGSFGLEIAGQAVRVETDHAELAERLAARYADFRATLQSPDLTARIRWVGYRRDHALLDVGMHFDAGRVCFAADGYQGQIDPGAGQAELEIASRQPIQEVDYFLRVIYALLAFERGGLMFHAAGIMRSGQTYLFFGHSGAGKTTVARLSSDATVLNDDLLLLLPGAEGTPNSWEVFGTPFWNPTQVAPSASHAPLHGLYRLVQADQVRLETLETAQALAEMVSNVPVIPADPHRNPALLERLQLLTDNVPVYALYFLPDASFWQIIHPQPTARAP